MTLNYTHIIDLSHPIAPHMPHWPGDPETKIEECADIGRDGYNLSRLTIGEHTGTHLGAPRHFCETGVTVDEIPPGYFMAPAIVINMEAKAALNRDALLSVKDIVLWEKMYGFIKSGSIALVKTGWSHLWGDESAYFAIAKDGLHFPGISLVAARYLVQELDIIGLGIDTAGIDGGRSIDFKTSKLLAEQNVYHLENLNLAALTITHLTLVVAPLPISGGSGSPCRILGFF